MIATGQISLDLIISRVAGLPDWKDCFERMQLGEYMRAVLNPNLWRFRGWCGDAALSSTPAIVLPKAAQPSRQCRRNAHPYNSPE
jgi:hypothetical protein